MIEPIQVCPPFVHQFNADMPFMHQCNAEDDVAVHIKAHSDPLTPPEAFLK